MVVLWRYLRYRYCVDARVHVCLSIPSAVYTFKSDRLMQSTTCRLASYLTTVESSGASTNYGGSPVTITHNAATYSEGVRARIRELELELGFGRELLLPPAFSQCLHFG